MTIETVVGHPFVSPIGGVGGGGHMRGISSTPPNALHLIHERPPHVLLRAEVHVGSSSRRTEYNWRRNIGERNNIIKVSSVSGLNRCRNDPPSPPTTSHQSQQQGSSLSLGVGRGKLVPGSYCWCKFDNFGTCLSCFPNKVFEVPQWSCRIKLINILR